MSLRAALLLLSCVPARAADLPPDAVARLRRHLSALETRVEPLAKDRPDRFCLDSERVGLALKSLDSAFKVSGKNADLAQDLQRARLAAEEFCAALPEGWEALEPGEAKGYAQGGQAVYKKLRPVLTAVAARLADKPAAAPQAAGSAAKPGAPGGKPQAPGALSTLNAAPGSSGAALFDGAAKAMAPASPEPTFAAYGFKDAQVKDWMAASDNQWIATKDFKGARHDAKRGTLTFERTGQSPALVVLRHASGGRLQDEVWTVKKTGPELVFVSEYNAAFDRRQRHARVDHKGAVYFQTRGERREGSGWAGTDEWSSPERVKDRFSDWVGEGIYDRAGDYALSWDDYKEEVAQGTTFKAAAKVGQVLGAAGEVIVGGVGSAGGQTLGGLGRAVGADDTADLLLFHSRIEALKAARSVKSASVMAAATVSTRALALAGGLTPESMRDEPDSVVLDAFLNDVKDPGTRVWILGGYRQSFVEERAEGSFKGLPDALARAEAQMPKDYKGLVADQAFAAFVLGHSGAQSGVDALSRENPYAGGAAEFTIALGKGAAGGVPLGAAVSGLSARLASAISVGGRVDGALAFLNTEVKALSFMDTAVVGGVSAKNVIGLSNNTGGAVKTALSGAEGVQAQALARKMAVGELLNAPATALFSGGQLNQLGLDFGDLVRDPSARTLSQLSGNLATMAAFALGGSRHDAKPLHPEAVAWYEANREALLKDPAQRDRARLEIEKGLRELGPEQRKAPQGSQRERLLTDRLKLLGEAEVRELKRALGSKAADRPETVFATIGVFSLEAFSGDPKTRGQEGGLRQDMEGRRLAIETAVRHNGEFLHARDGGGVFVFANAGDAAAAAREFQALTVGGRRFKAGLGSGRVSVAEEIKSETRLLGSVTNDAAKAADGALGGTVVLSRSLQTDPAVKRALAERPDPRPARGPPPPQETVRTVTGAAVRADLIGSTALGKDPVRMKRVLKAFETVAQDIARRYGGDVLRTIGDEVILHVEGERGAAAAADLVASGEAGGELAHLAGEPVAMKAASGDGELFIVERDGGRIVDVGGRLIERLGEALPGSRGKVTALAPEAASKTVPLSEVRPTQMAVGKAQCEAMLGRLREEARVDRAKEPARYEGLNEAETFAKYLKETIVEAGLPVGAFIGPDGKTYVTDGHHRTVAISLALEGELRNVRADLLPGLKVDVLGDFRGRPPEEFAKAMRQAGSGQFTPELEARMLERVQELRREGAADPEGRALAELYQNLPKDFASIENDSTRALIGEAFKAAGLNSTVYVDYIEFRAGDWLAAQGITLERIVADIRAKGGAVGRPPETDPAVILRMRRELLSASALEGILGGASFKAGKEPIAKKFIELSQRLFTQEDYFRQKGVSEQALEHFRNSRDPAALEPELQKLQGRGPPEVEALAQWKKSLEQLKSLGKDAERMPVLSSRLASEFKAGFAGAKAQMEGFFPEETFGKVGARPKNASSIEAKLSKAHLKKLEQGGRIEDLRVARDAIDDAIGTRITLSDPSPKTIDAIVDRLVAGIEKGELGVTKINNYRAKTEGLPYCTEAQLERIKQAVERRGGRVEIVSGEKAQKASGYTSLQMAVRYRNGATGELQIRGHEVNILAEIEHINYDLKEGKGLSPSLQKIPQLAAVAKAISGLDARQLGAFNDYIAAKYRRARLAENGGRPPEVPLPEALRSHPELSIDAIAAHLPLH